MINDLDLGSWIIIIDFRQKKATHTHDFYSVFQFHLSIFKHYTAKIFVYITFPDTNIGYFNGFYRYLKIYLDTSFEQSCAHRRRTPVAHVLLDLLTDSSDKYR